VCLRKTAFRQRSAQTNGNGRMGGIGINKVWNSCHLQQQACRAKIERSLPMLACWPENKVSEKLKITGAYLAKQMSV